MYHPHESQRLVRCPIDQHEYAFKYLCLFTPSGSIPLLNDFGCPQESGDPACSLCKRLFAQTLIQEFQAQQTLHEGFPPLPPE